MMRRFKPAFFTFFLLLPVLLPAQDLSIRTEDLSIEQGADGGFHLYIRKTGNIRSVLLTESTRDPGLRADSYAYRAPQWNAVNGDEIRILNGEKIPKEKGLWSLIDSTPEIHGDMGEVFHIYIPYILNYGYEGQRHGEVYVKDGTYLNIRSFSLPYADYAGRYADNPFTLRVTQKPLPGPAEDNYMKETEDSFSKLTGGGGELYYSTGPDDLLDKIRQALDKEKGRDLDLVLCLDTTGSMKDDIAEIRKNLIPMLENAISGFPSFRIGMVLYKDYYEEYLTRVVAFTEDFDKFQRTLNGINPRGGRDIPEAVYEALYDGAVSFPWEAQSRLLILIGDAPPHLRQQGKISAEMAENAAKERNIKVSAIILPQ